MLNKQAAFDLEITEKTIKVHRARVMEKMGANPCRPGFALPKNSDPFLNRLTLLNWTKVQYLSPFNPRRLQITFPCMPLFRGKAV